jgi:hypothetical protein
MGCNDQTPTPMTGDVKMIILKGLVATRVSIAIIKYVTLAMSAVSLAISYWFWRLNVLYEGRQPNGGYPLATGQYRTVRVSAPIPSFCGPYDFRADTHGHAEA